MPINILSQETINKIAAGEVLERPSNAVKELVENSIDAFSSCVTVEIEEAGKKLIRISDNGFGMDKNDLELSILRHATSKIETFNDLSHIHSLGFRGEALASIVAVSNFEMKTRKKDEDVGWKLLTDGGKDAKIIPWSGAQGTITEVRNLFFNTPARKKFLKKDPTERAKIINLLEETALANQEIAFKLLSENRIVFFAPQTESKIERISDVLGKNFAKTLRNVKIDHAKISADIYFTGRNDSALSRKYQYLFVNSRPVNYPKWLVHCVYQAYKESIISSRHPGVLIYITIDPLEIDVNIHPAKKEIKFATEGVVYDIIFKTLKAAVTSHVFPEIKINPDPIVSKNKIFKNTFAVAHSSRIDEGNKASGVFEGRIQKEHKDSPVVISEWLSKYRLKNHSIDKYANVFVKQTELMAEKFDGDIKVIGQVFDAYVIVENEGNLYIFDQHAAAERVRYELYLNQMRDQAVKTQQMLMPETFGLPPNFSELLKVNISLLNELGIAIEEFGQNFFRITTYPALLGNTAIEPIVKTIISDIENDKNIELEQKRDKIIRFACRASIKAGDKISFTEAKKLVNDLFKCEHPFTCPHGRPTAQKISLKELEKFFKRR